MTKEEILEEFKEVLRPYATDKDALDNLTEKSGFISDLKINSANVVDVFLDTEEKFDIEINNDSLEKIKNVGDAVQEIYIKIQESKVNS